MIHCSTFLTSKKDTIAPQFEEAFLSLTQLSDVLFLVARCRRCCCDLGGHWNISTFCFILMCSVLLFRLTVSPPFVSRPVCHLSSPFTHRSLPSLTPCPVQYLAEEQQRIGEIDKMQASANIAIEERHKREAAEMGRRQREGLAMPKS